MQGDWRLYALASAVFAALTAIFGKLGVSEINSDMATFIRTGVILLLTVCVVELKGAWESPTALSTKGLTYLIVSGLATGASWLCYYRALTLGPAAKVAPLDKTSVIFVVLFAMVFLGERVSWKEGLGVSLIAAGAIILAFVKKQKDDPKAVLVKC